MDSSYLIIICAVAGLVWFALATWNEGPRKAKKLDKAFTNRKRLSPREYYETFFQQEGFSEEVAVGVREVLEQQLDVDLSRLSSCDDFSKNLSFFWEFDSMADVAIVVALENRFSIKISDDEASSARTIKDLVCLVESKRKGT
ncbi:MAG: hypothetical protein GJ671_09945 [Alteromonadaceae bacterium]|nr:hypothetical protein [Alteromonadaceae bacterium]